MVRFSLIAAALCACVLAAKGPADEADILIPGEKVETLTTDVDFAEGPAAGHDGKIYFSDIPTGAKAGRILRYDPKTGKIDVYQADSRKSNGLFFDAAGRLVACEGADHGGRRISRSTLDGPVETVVDNFEGKKFNAPNDLCVDGRGRIWFTDPKYLGDEPRELDVRGVYRVDPDGSLHLAVGQPRIEKPNGIHVSIDGRMLFVADTNNEPVKLDDGSTRPGAMQLVAFAILGNGNLGKKTVLVDFAPDNGVDGMTLDDKGNIYAAVRSKKKPGIYVFSPTGKRLAIIATDITPTNCIFGRGDEATRLYITTDKSFCRVRLKF